MGGAIGATSPPPMSTGHKEKKKTVGKRIEGHTRYYMGPRGGSEREREFFIYIPLQANICAKTRCQKAVGGGVKNCS